CPAHKINSAEASKRFSLLIASSSLRTMAAYEQLDMGFGRIVDVPSRFADDYNRPLTMGAGNIGDFVLMTSRRDDLPHIVVKKIVLEDNLTVAKLALRELTILKNIRHENLVRFLSAYTADVDANTLSTFYHVTEYSGDSLRQIITRNDKITMRDIKSLMTQLLRACKNLNSAEVIFRDINPGNIFCENGKLTLFEFGMARVIDRYSTMSKDRCEQSYMAIEMMHEWKGHYDEKVDMWSVGAILCELLTGSAIFGEHGRHSLDIPMQICGPISEEVLDQIESEHLKGLLRKEQGNAKRIDFFEYLMQKGRKWLKKDIRSNKEELLNFIDQTLQFNPNHRMSVDEALAHPFLAGFYDSSRDDNAQQVVPPELPLPANEQLTLQECKRRIWAEIQTSPAFP
ncbi:hypothetical protein PFISCL1PPCAC_21967, partial [Pristionchus fissidentatus]